MDHSHRFWKTRLVFLCLIGMGIAGAALALRGCATGPGRGGPGRRAKRFAQKAVPAVVVVTCYPGMSASSIEKTITNRIERWVNQFPGAERVTSRSMRGVSIVHVEYREDIDPNTALTAIGEFALKTLAILPPQTLPPVVLPLDPNRYYPLGMLVVRNRTEDEATLRDVGRIQVRNMLGALKGCVAPVAVGGKDRTMLVLLKPKEMKARHLSATDVSKALEKCSMVGKAGIAHFGRYQLLLDANVIGGNPKELMDLPICSEPVVVRLRDVGDIRDNDSTIVRFRMNSRRAVAVPIFPQLGANPEAVADGVERHLPFLAQHLPRDINVRWVPFDIEGDPSQPDDDGLLTIHVRAPSYTSLDGIEKRIAVIERLLEHNIPVKERVAILSELGMQPDWAALYTANAGPQDATIRVQLSAERTRSTAAYASELRRLIHNDATLADLGIRFVTRDMPAPMDVRIDGNKPEDGLRLAWEIRRRLAAIRGTVDVDVAQRMDTPYLVIQVNRERAGKIGLSARDIFDQTLAAMQAEGNLDPDTQMEIVGDEALIPLQGQPGEGKTIEDLQNIEIVGLTTEFPVKLSQLADMRRTTAAIEIDHVNLARVFDVRANIEGRERREVIADIQKMLGELHVPKGLSVKLGD